MRLSRAGRSAAPLAVALAAFACGGNHQGPVTPTQPTPPTYSVTATVFYDENGNGQLDPEEAARVPGVQVVIGSGTGTSAPGTGVAQVTGIAEGTYAVSVSNGSLPTYYQPLPAGTVQVPGTAEVKIPLTLPIGANQPGVYFGYGDSITLGDGSSDGQGYRQKLQDLLAPYFGRAEVETFGRSGTDSREGEQRARTWVRTYRAAYVLILYGTNDWQDQTCQNQGPDACFTIDSLSGIIDACQEFDSLPVLGTILPVNPSLAPAGRNTWIDQMNVKIKALAQQRQVLLADVNAEFKNASVPLSSLFWNDVHPNDAGYQVLAQAWFKAITRGRSAAASSSRRHRLFGFLPH
ncbi:MAG TPA: SGNH/GDSL hydrolase family protein [Vicinamibacteria bacterium]|nr:SGNH/GDSL hydrolase family protein [Vicinamibacteria bacterium]